VKIDNLKNLIDELYLIYGNDCENQGKLTNKDIELYRDKVFYTLFRRKWTNNQKYNKKMTF
jgi:hypothetical protein